MSDRQAPIRWIAGALIGFVSVSVMAEERRGAAELFGGFLALENRTSSEARLDLLGLRFSGPLKGRWSLEGSLGRVDEPGFEAFFGDLSLRALLRDRERFDLFLLAGPGLLSVDFKDEEPSDDSLTLHAGLAATIDLGDRVYLRPQLRQIWIDEEAVDDLQGELTLGIGVRF